MVMGLTWFIFSPQPEKAPDVVYTSDMRAIGGPEGMYEVVETNPGEYDMATSAVLIR